MYKKLIIFLLIILVAIIGLYSVYSISNSQTENYTTITAYADSPITVGNLIEAIKTDSYFEGYNKDTLKWLETLNSNDTVISNNDSYIIMSESEGNKLNISSVTDVSITDTFECNILENKSLGNNLKDIVHIDHVKLESQDIKNYPV